MNRENANPLLMVNEDSQEHNANIATWKDMEVHLAKGLTVERKEMALVEAGKRWCEVLH